MMEKRPEIITAEVRDNMRVAEKFQNATLRPIIKMLHPLFIVVFKNYIKNKKNIFYDLSLIKKSDYIENILLKDLQCRSELRGMIIGQFSLEEYEIYSQISSDSNKRMVQMLKERMINSIPELMPEA